MHTQKDFLKSFGFGKAFKSTNKRFRRATFELILSLNSWSRVLVGQGFRQHQVKDESEFDGVPVGKKRRFMVVSDTGPDRLSLGQQLQAHNYCFEPQVDVNHTIWNATRSTLRGVFDYWFHTMMMTVVYSLHYRPFLDVVYYSAVRAVSAE